MAKNPFENRGNVVDYGKERGLLDEGEKPEVILERLKEYETKYSYNSFKVKAIGAILDALNRKKKDKGLAITGSFKGMRDAGETIKEEKKSKSPKEYLDMVLKEFVKQTALETDFIEQFIIDNPKLDERAKKFMIIAVTSQEGPWLNKQSIVDVSQEDDIIIVTDKNRSTFRHYME